MIEFGLVMHFDKDVHAAFERRGFDFAHQAVVERSNDDQDCIRPDTARLVRSERPRS